MANPESIKERFFLKKRVLFFCEAEASFFFFFWLFSATLELREELRGPLVDLGQQEAVAVADALPAVAAQHVLAIQNGLVNGSAELVLGHRLGIISDARLLGLLLGVLQSIEELLARDVAACQDLLQGDEALTKPHLPVLLGVRRSAVVEGDVDLERLLLVARELHLLVVGCTCLLCATFRVHRSLINVAEARDAVDVGRRQRLGVVRGPVPVAADHCRSLVAVRLAVLAEVEGLDRGIVLVVLLRVVAAEVLVTGRALVREELGTRLHADAAGLHIVAAVLTESVEVDRHLGLFEERERVQGLEQEARSILRPLRKNCFF